MKGISGFYRHQWQVLLVCLFLLLGTMLLSLMFGATSVSIQTIIDSFTHFDATNQAHQVIQTVRLPRILGAAFVGASLAVSGALAQGITQNHWQILACWVSMLGLAWAWRLFLLSSLRQVIGGF